ncbi:MAG: radical SAM protein [Verrucomicrobiae bacterium]|nr:radical SAM protein [Verrucomicrobiae bacterium]
MILLATLNARYLHAAFGLRYLLANMGELRGQTRMLEFDINQRPLDIAEKIAAHTPRILGLGVYIWNATETLELVSLLRRILPETKIVLGGPEVSYETAEQEIVALADYVITGEADLAFAQLCRRILAGEAPAEKIVEAGYVDVAALTLPYDLYTPDDIAHRIVYVEASRGCPYTCEFCLSSLDIPVRAFPLEKFLAAMQSLLDRGVRHFKFVDRTFNLNAPVSRAIMGFFLDRHTPGMFLHFEMVPDRLPDALKDLIRRFPPGALQFEVGIQTFDGTVGGLISRRQNFDKIAENLRFLREESGVHVHADLIFGLPGETLGSFAEGFNRLVAMNPQEIQLGMLKRLRGTPIIRHDAEWSMVYAAHPPYEVLSTRLIDFSTMQRVRRVAKYWDLVANSGNFPAITRMIWSRNGKPFESFLDFSDWLFARLGRTDSIALNTLAAKCFEYLTREAGFSEDETGAAMATDFIVSGRASALPDFLRPYLPERTAAPSSSHHHTPKRQARHVKA